MKRLALNKYGKSLTAAALLWAMFAMPFAAFGQTRIVAPKNNYSVQKDVELGRQAAAQVEQQMPILNDNQSTQYLQQVGERLANAIPPEYRHPEFHYTFQIVNARDINAFALPGGPMFVNRGMIEAAQNEGEMAGVMAHELSHVALRHATAQATKSQNPTAQLPALGGAILGAILGGTVGGIAQTAGQLGSAAIVTKYSREYETQADTLGAQIMARAGYDPTDLANMFKTIERQSGGSGGPEWLSTHPNPGNRYSHIEQEAQLLRVSPEPIKITQGFIRTKRYLQSLPQAPTMAQIEQGQVRGTSSGGTMSGGRYESSVEYPSSRMRTNNLGVASVNTPENWQAVNQSNSEVWFAPQGAFGNQGITRGAIVGISQNSGGSLQQATSSYVQGILQSNTYLRARSNYQRAIVGGRGGLAIALAGTSPVSGTTEVDTIYTTQLRDGSLFYIVTVAPQNEASNYNYAFRNMVRSVRLNDR